MAEQVFAISPIAASGTLPNDTDYNAISAAFMETARGRWFLNEYARRNRNTDTQMVLEAVGRIERSMVAQKDPPSGEVPGVLAAMRALVAAARESAETALAPSAFADALAPSRKCARVIREIAWGLRESGADGRICNLLDMQVDAIGQACDEFSGESMCDSVLAAFDAAERELAELAQSHAARDAASKAASAPDDPPNNVVQSTVVQASFAQAGPARTPAQTPPARPAAPAQVTPFLMPSPFAVQPELRVVATAKDSYVDPDADAEATPLATPSSASLETAAATGADANPDAGVDSSLDNSLGASLLASGVVAAPVTLRGDPMAPLRRMSTAEKLAFFS